MRSAKAFLQCSNHRLSNCPAKFFVKPKKPDYILAERRPGKDTVYKFNYEKEFKVEDFEVDENSGNFEHSHFCVNQVPLEYRVFDFDILNSRDKQLIRKEKKYKYTDFDEETAFRKEFRFGHTRQSMISNKDEIMTQATVMNAADIIDSIIDR